jgi:hypothetical protein
MWYVDCPELCGLDMTPSVIDILGPLVFDGTIDTW